MSGLLPLQPLFDESPGPRVSLPAPIRRVYGEFRLPARPGGAYVIANFASTVDGVVAMGGPGGAAGGTAITGPDLHDRFVMGLLRSLADAVVVGAGTLRSVPHHIWTAPHVFPPMAEAFAQIRRDRRRPTHPLNVIVSGRGALDVRLPVFHSDDVAAMVVTRSERVAALRAAGLPRTVRVVGVRSRGPLRAAAVLDAVRATVPAKLVLVEGGPHLMGSFFGEGLLDELFLTLAPQVAGRDDRPGRLGLVMGRALAPKQPVWGSLVGASRSTRLLFLRYAFTRDIDASSPRREASGPGSSR